MEFFILGDEEVVLGFRLIGIKGIVCDVKEEAETEFDRITNGDYGEIGVLFITEKIGMLLSGKVLDWQFAGEYPLLVEIPGIEGHIEGKVSLLESIRKAIGLPV